MEYEAAHVEKTFTTIRVFTSFAAQMKENARSHPLYFSIRTAGDEVIESGRRAVDELQKVISSVLRELHKVRDIIDPIKKKKQESPLTWSSRKLYYYGKACQELRQKSVDCDKFQFSLDQLTLDFKNVISDYKKLRDLCRESTERSDSSYNLLQAACNMLRAGVNCARVAGLVVWLANAGNTLPASWNIVDALLQELKEACEKQQQSLAEKAKNNRQIMEKVEQEAQRLQDEFLSALSRFQSMKEDIDDLRRLVMDARSGRRKLSSLVKYAKFDRLLNDLRRLRVTCDGLLGQLDRAHLE